MYVKSGREKKNYAVITISDTGEGMDDETMKHIFNPFFTTKPPGKGTGLGLTSVYSLVTGIGGHIDVTSVKGIGTTFNIYLPAVEGSVLQSDDIRESFESRKKEISILLVDDEEVIIEIGREFLTSLGYTVLEAREGETALEIYREYADEIGIVLLDMMMPGMKGDEVFEELVKINPM